MTTKFFAVVVGLSMVAAACTAADGDQTSPPVSTTIEPTTTGVAVGEEPPNTIPDLDAAALESAPDSDSPAGSFCERYDPVDNVNGAFTEQSCDGTPSLEIIAITTLCPSGNCLDGFEIVVETAEPFSISADDPMPANEIRGIDISVRGTLGEFRCTVRNSLGTRQVGCLGTDQALSAPPEDVWVPSADGSRHRFGSGANVMGDIVSISVLLTEVSDGPQGAVGTFNVIDPIFPGRHTASASGAAAVVRDLIGADLAVIGAETPEETTCVTSEIETRLTTAELTTAVVHGAVEYSDKFVEAAAESFEICKPILEVYRADFERSPLTPECVEVMSEAIADEFDWQGIIDSVRLVAVGDLTKSERDRTLETLTLQKYVEFDCVAVE